MEFNEKLQELRKSKGLTQEELAEKLFVSRTAISKWESGRGYPSIDSLKEIARFFSVTIDDLICSDEMISVAENEKREFADKYVSLICNVMDILPVILLFIPAFGNGSGSSDGYPSGYTAVYTGIWKRIGFLRNSIPVWAERDYSVGEDRVCYDHRHYDLEWNLWSNHR